MYIETGTPLPLVAAVDVVVHAERRDDVVGQRRRIVSAPFIDLERHLTERCSRYVRFADRGALHDRSGPEQEHGDDYCAGEHFCSTGDLAFRTRRQCRESGAPAAESRPGRQTPPRIPASRRSRGRSPRRCGDQTSARRIPCPRPGSAFARIAIGTDDRTMTARRSRAAFGEVRQNDRQRDERDERPDAAAGFGDGERDVRQLEHVALAQDRNSGRAHHGFSQTREATSCKREGDLIEDERGQGHHQGQQREREREVPQMGRAPHEENRARHERRRVEIRVRKSSAARVPAAKGKQTEKDEHQPRAMRLRRRCGAADRGAPSRSKRPAG